MEAEPARIFALPDLGEGLLEAEIVAWHVAAGDHVVADQPLVSVETDKAVVEIPCPRAGRIAQLLAAPHDTLKIGAPLVAFSTGDEPDAGTVVGELMPEKTRPRAAPAVRALAATMGVDLAAVTASGAEGDVTRADVERAAVARSGAEPLRGVRRAMALRMAEAGAAMVPATVTDEADIAAWEADTDVTARLVAALVTACRAEPALNVTFDGQAMTRRSNAEANIGIATDTPDGLIVPVLRHAELLDPAALRAALTELTEAVRARRIAPDLLRGATITLSNFGPLGGRFAALVVVPPQVGILGAGRAFSRVVADGASFAAHRMLPLSLTFDHRAVSGGEAARFLAAVKATLETPTAQPVPAKP